MELVAIAEAQPKVWNACTSGSLDPSHVLLALGMPHEIAHGSLRLSLSEYNSMSLSRMAETRAIFSSRCSQLSFMAAAMARMAGMASVPPRRARPRAPPPSAPHPGQAGEAGL